MQVLIFELYIYILRTKHDKLVNISKTQQVYKQAVRAMNNIFFVGLQEAYEVSVHLLLRELNMKQLTSSIVINKERDQTSAQKVNKEKNILRNDSKLMKRAQDVNSYDGLLYQIGKLLSFVTISFLRF